MLKERPKLSKYNRTKFHKKFTKIKWLEKAKGKHLEICGLGKFKEYVKVPKDNVFLPHFFRLGSYLMNFKRNSVHI